ncbi:MAG: SMC family ATPase [Gemmatimonadetes bacterium]|nr:SMC family ATPase [Gemmatimonadota bacterium]
MRPLRITIEGLRSFRGEVPIDFAGRVQIAVIGDTGAGKSSILEAMTYALYGQTSLGSRSKKELMNDTSDVMRVVLRFRVSGEEWEVTRVDRRAGAGGLRPPQAQLVRYGPGGETLEKLEQVRPVNERVQALIGLDSDAFLRTVILPQGRFARLLVEDAPSARTEILRQVWRTHDLEAAGAMAGQSFGEVRTLAARLGDELGRHERYMDDPEAHLAELTSRADATSRRADALADLHDRSARARDALRQSEAMMSAVRRADERVTPSAMDELADRLTPVESTQRKLQTDATGLERREAGLKRDLSGIPVDDGPGEREVARTLAALEAIPNEVAKAVDAAESLREAIASEAASAKHHVETQETLESASDRLTRHEALGPPLAEAVGSAREVLAEGNRWYEKCNGLQERIRSTEDALASRKRGMAESAVRLATAQRELQGEQERLQRTERALSEARRTNAAAAAAHGLCPGDECPVCQGDLPEGWTPPQDAGLDAARDTQRAARSQADEASRAVADLEGRQESGQQRIRETAKELDDLRLEIADATNRLGSAAGLDDAFPSAGGGPLPGRDRILAPIRQRLREAEAKLDEHGTEAVVLRETQTSAQMAKQSALQALNQARSDIDRTRNTARETLDGLRQRLQSIPQSLRPQLVLPSDPTELGAVDLVSVDRASHRAREREKILQQRDQERNRLRAEIEETGTALKNLRETRRVQVEEPLQAMVRTLSNHRIPVADAVRELSADIAIPAAIHYPVDAGTLQIGIGHLRDTMAEVLALSANLRRRALAAADKARDEARTVAEQLEPPVDPTDPDAVVQATGTAATEAGYTARAAREDRAAFAAILDDLLKLRETAGEVARLELALSDLDAALKPGAFLKWLTLRRSRDLLVYASRMLEEITAGRYSFADPGDLEDQQWLVVDNDSGQARSPASLSGGEQFIGSLALALGMVEMMARSGGRLESLFLDEGFGSLDRTNLDSAIEALSTVAGRGRMVGVISHVGAVAEQIDDVLAVTRDATGSRVTWLSRAQRREVARSDTGFEGASGASALAGLLD